MRFVEIELNPASLVIRPLGWHRWLALKQSLYVAKADVVSVEQAGRIAENGPVGLRFPGTNVPGTYLAGTFWKFWGPPSGRMKSFWVRRHPDACIRLTFANHDYDYAVVEVENPDAEIARIESWLASKE